MIMRQSTYLMHSAENSAVFRCLLPYDNQRRQFSNIYFIFYRLQYTCLKPAVLV